MTQPQPDESTDGPSVTDQRIYGEPGRLERAPHDPIAHSLEAVAVLASSGAAAYREHIRAARAAAIAKDL